MSVDVDALLTPSEKRAAEERLNARRGPVELAGLLARVREDIRRYVVLGEDELTLLALFAAHTYVADAAEATPYIVVESPEKASGKTRLMEVLALLCVRPWLTSSINESTLFRGIEAERPTLLLDEVDALFKSNSERTEPVRAVLNAGNKKNATVPRCVPPKFEVHRFSTYCPKVLSGIATGKLPETIRDRAVTVKMRRRHAGETVERFYYRHASQATEATRADLEVWADWAHDLLAEAEPSLPSELLDRMADALEPLFAIADLAGGTWPLLARKSALELTRIEADDELGRGAQLLAAMRTALGEAEVIFTEDALEAINGDDELPFGGWGDGRGLDARGLAKLLRPYGVRPKSVRLGAETRKGYDREHLADAWVRYLPAEKDDQEEGLSPYLKKATQATRATQPDLSDTEKPHGEANVSDVSDVSDFSGMAGRTTTNPTRTRRGCGRSAKCPSLRPRIFGLSAKRARTGTEGGHEHTSEAATRCGASPRSARSWTPKLAGC